MDLPLFDFIFSRTGALTLGSLIANALLASGYIHPADKEAWAQGLGEIVGYIGASATILIGLHHSHIADREKLVQEEVKKSVETKTLTHPTGSTTAVTYTTTTASTSPQGEATLPGTVSSYIP